MQVQYCVSTSVIHSFLSFSALHNNSAVQVTKNPEHHGRIKHLDLRYYWLRDQVNMGVIRILHLRTDEMPADLITKALGRIKVQLFTKMIGLADC